MASEYLGPDGVWYPYGQGPNPNGTAPLDRPTIDTGLTQTPKVATPYSGAATTAATSALRGSDAYSRIGGRGLDPGMSTFLSSLTRQIGAGLGPADDAPGSNPVGGDDAITGGTQKIVDQAGAGLADTLKDVASERATASPRGMVQALGLGAGAGGLGAGAGTAAGTAAARRKFGSPVNLEALLSQLR